MPGGDTAPAETEMQSLLEELCRHCNGFTFRKLFLMEPNPMATGPVAEIKEVNRPGDDIRAF